MGIKQIQVVNPDGGAIGTHLLWSSWNKIEVNEPNTDTITLKEALVGTNGGWAKENSPIMTQIGDVQDDLEEAKGIIDEHTSTLSTHTTTLNEHASTLGTHATAINTNASSITALDQTVLDRLLMNPETGGRYHYDFDSHSIYGDIFANQQAIAATNNALVFKQEPNESAMLKDKGLKSCGSNAVVLGTYNEPLNDCLLVVGNGSENAPRNAFRLEASGNGIFSGTIKVGTIRDSLAYYDDYELVPAKLIKGLNQELIRFQQKADLPLTIMTLPCDADITLMHNYEYRCILDEGSRNPQISLNAISGVSTQESNFASTVIFQGQKAEDPFTITNNITGTPLVYKGESLANTGGIKIVKGTTYRLSFVYDGLQIICYVSTI